MALGPRLEVSQTQRLSMTPQLRQAIALLQMTNLELSDHIAEEAEKNPLLELVEPDPPDDIPVLPFDTVRNHDTESFTSLPSTRYSGKLDGLDSLENIEDEKTLRDSLREEIHLSNRNVERVNIALVLIDELDEQGWLTAPLFEISDRLGVSQAAIEEALEALQACEPVGIGARNLQECLELQLKEAGNFTAVMQVLTTNLDAVAGNELTRLETLADVPRHELDDAIKVLRQLNPRPVAYFVNDFVQIAIADVSVSLGPLGSWAVELNTDALPRALVNEKYFSEVAKDGSEASEYVTECRANARFLVKAMDQRAKTILRVATVIVRHQNRFFEEGINGLRPLTLSTVATELGIHESTVSRVTNGKYLYCQRGTFELRFFFVQGIRRSDGGSDMAAPVVREKIRKLVAEEQPDNVLSDEKIAKNLQEDGVDVARRTVAKYREAMGIPSSSRRRRKHT
ncbi:RNA polymerase sigma-54 factor [Rhodobacterales bacterium 52_120_T64]|nr:RNA polymerase sigma-54 factor [Rhodobacterales bacterium 52_120_T64]